MDLGSLRPDRDGLFSSGEGSGRVSGRHPALAQLQPGNRVVVQRNESQEHGNGLVELLGCDQRIGQDAQRVCSIQAGQFGIVLEGSPGQSTGGEGVGGLSEVGQCGQQPGVLQPRVVGPLQDPAGPQAEGRAELRVVLLARQLTVGQSQAAVLVEWWEVREVVEWFEGTGREGASVGHEVCGLGVVDADAVVSRGDVRDIGGRRGHVTRGTAVCDVLSRRTFGGQPAGVGLVAFQALGSEDGGGFGLGNVSVRVVTGGAGQFR